MSRVARFTPPAGRDIDEIAERIAIDNIDAAIRFCQAVRKNAESLAEMPGMGAIYGLKGTRFDEARFWPITGFRNYLLFIKGLPMESRF